jgi:hypothetical protein
VAEQAAAGETAGLGGDLGGDLGADLGGEEGLETDLLGGEEGALEEPAPEDESALLTAPPGSRFSPRITPGAKGKVYNPKKVDRRDAGARQRSNASQYNSEKSKNTLRTTFPGYSDGLKSLAKGFVPTAESIYPKEEPIYSLREQQEEDNLILVNESLRNLAEQLEGKDNNLIMEHNDEN